MTRRIHTVHLFLVTNDEGDEGVAAFYNPAARRLEPMVAASPEKLEEMTEVAQGMVGLSLKPMRLARFTQREDVKDILPSRTEVEP